MTTETIDKLKADIREDYRALVFQVANQDGEIDAHARRVIGLAEVSVGDFEKDVVLVRKRRDDAERVTAGRKAQAEFDKVGGVEANEKAIEEARQTFELAEREYWRIRAEYENKRRAIKTELAVQGFLSSSARPGCDDPNAPESAKLSIDTPSPIRFVGWNPETYAGRNTA